MSDTAGAALLRRLGRVEYEPTEAAMRRFTESRDAGTPDEIWLCEHPPVYTLGIAGKPEHVLNPGAIPVLRTARGGQVTYHGPGQVVAYPLIDLARQSLHVKEYVYRLEDAVLRTLESLHVTGHRVPGAPGVYVRVDDPFGHARLEPGPPGEPFRGLAKIAALGVKISRHRTWHGVALNVAMDLKPFDGINPCGYAGLATTDLATLGIAADTELVAERLGHFLVARLAR